MRRNIKMKIYKEEVVNSVITVFFFGTCITVLDKQPNTMATNVYTSNKSMRGISHREIYG